MHNHSHFHALNKHRFISLKNWSIWTVFPILFFSLYTCKPESEATQTPTFNYELEAVYEVEGRQGVATDGQIYVVSGSKALYRYSLTGELLAGNMEPFIDLEGEINHLGDIAIHGDEVFTGVENFINGRGENIQIAIYDLETLQFKRSIPWEPSSGQVEVCGIAIDENNQSVWLADWLNGQYLYRYDLRSGEYIGRLELKPTPSQIQGIEVYDNMLFLTADDGDADFEKHDHLYTVPLASHGKDSSAKVVHEKTLDEFKRAGEIEGLCFFPSGDRLIILMNRGTRIVQGMPQGFYPGYDREIHELYVYKVHQL